MSNIKINLFQYEKGRMLQDPCYHTLEDAITINNLSPKIAKKIWEDIGNCIKGSGTRVRGVDSSVCPFCLLKDGYGCNDCEYSGKATICTTSQDDFPCVHMLSNNWYKKTYQIINL